VPAMYRLSRIALALICLVPLVHASQPPQRPAATGSTRGRGAGAKNPFVGTWRLVSIERRAADGSSVPGVNPVGGVDPTGTVMYDADGHVSLQIMPRGRPKTLNILQPLTPDQAKAALFGYIAYFGTYTLDERQRVMHIHFDGSLNPSMEDTDGERYYEFNGNRMTFRAGTTATTRLTWERVGK
jgi:hypothetical protein